MLYKPRKLDGSTFPAIPMRHWCWLLDALWLRQFTFARQYIIAFCHELDWPTRMAKVVTGIVYVFKQVISDCFCLQNKQKKSGPLLGAYFEAILSSIKPKNKLDQSHSKDDASE
jgi:hypothetical protein